jgi:subtilisin family serine protease
MTKSHLTLQALLGLFLAFGLIFSPLQNPAVVFSAQPEEDTAPPADSVQNPAVVNDAVGQPVNEQSSIEQPSPVEVGSSPEPVLSEGTSVAETNPVEPVSSPGPDTSLATEVPADAFSKVETIAPVDPIVQPTDEVHQTIETALPPAEIPPVVQPTALVVQLPAQEPTAAANVSASSDGVNKEQPAVNPAWTSGQAVVRFDPSIPMEEQIARLTGLGLEITASEPALGVLIVSVPKGLEQESVSALRAMSGIQFAEPDYLASALDVTPNDPGFVNQGDMMAIKAPGGWDYFTGSSNVIIAIVDSGVDLTHPDLAGKILPGYDFVNNDNVAQDDYGHGTHVAGIAAAIGNNSTGIAGLDWSAKILPVKVLDSSGFGSAFNVSQGIVYAVDHGAKIINLSLGFTDNSTLVAAAVEYAYQHGVTVVASTGNTNGAVTYPAALPHVIAVGAVDNTGTRWPSSNYGPEIDVVAPGVNVYSTNPSGYGIRTGTSMAAAHVSGLAALLEGMSPLTPDQIETTIASTSQDLGTTGWDTFFGNGLIQVRDALKQLFNTLFPVAREKSQKNISTTTFMPTLTLTPTPTAIP